MHGFNSSPASEKAQQFKACCQHLDEVELAIPEISFDPREAVKQLEKLVADAGQKLYLLVGSSLGGYYATWLAEKYACRAALVNPAVSPVKTLGEEFLGPQQNLYSGEEYEFTREHALFLDTLDINPLQQPENFLLLVQTGDSVLDYRQAVERYQGSLQVVQDEGSHRFENFIDVVPAMLEFAEHGTLAPETLKRIANSG